MLYSLAKESELAVIEPRETPLPEWEVSCEARRELKAGDGHQFMASQASRDSRLGEGDGGVVCE